MHHFPPYTPQEDLMKAEIINETPVNTAEVKDLLAKLRENGDTNFRINKTLEYLEQTIKLSSSQAKKIIEELHKLNVPRLRDHHVHKIVDILPVTLPDLKVLLQGYALTVSQENQKKIVEVLSKYASKPSS